MPKYEVEISRTQVHMTKVELEAEDEDAAQHTAITIVTEDMSETIPKLDWSLEEDELDIESCEELDEPEAA
jgi:hypothetical protein